MIICFLRKVKSIIYKNVPKSHTGFNYLNVDIQNGCMISGMNSIGEYTYIGMNCTITSSTIGRYCSIANNVSIGVGEHKLERISTSGLFYLNPFEELTEKECEVGNDVWIGTNSVIRRGVKIGNGAVIGANSFVNRDIPDFAIAVGSPARVIKYRFSEEQKALILESNWWELNQLEAKQVIFELESTLSKE